MLMHLAVATETARGWRKKTHGTCLLEQTFAFYKDINMIEEEEEKLPWQWGEVCFGDGDGPQSCEAGGALETASYSVALELHQWHTFKWLHCQKIWHQHIWGRYAQCKWGYDCELCLCALSMFYQDCATVAAQRIVCVPSQALTVAEHVGKKLSVVEKYCIRCFT